MRKVIVSMNITLDGYMAGPNGELDWHFECWDPQMGEQLARELSKADTILLGRVTYQAMAGFWPGKTSNPLCAREDYAYAVMMNHHQKAVFSRRLQKADWSNTIILKDEIEEGMLRLREESNGQNKNIIIYGSGRLVTALIKLEMIDEYQLWIHPVLIGKGKPFFGKYFDQQDLQLLSSTTFPSGVVLLHYQVLH
ncbi:dihydrofolate reductase family protein [Pseudobacter ginsenosidimutans]|uniref:Dihydrofolate reductase n=1 Tax=Pseudobacter ginsenosidimutans TaxID=661488 RepID=A0A4Q7MUK4_9BACT|nr:dihydrofolate reductase family protein [Pseudobacter ginsenosidimutans]QEC40996.1 dihydrofolate reductase [Pseudobacter ginsenosidimutans]RZS72258.1 dihydrofolate reductase [Pseudobacter ginsenosidimutans]